MTTGGTHSLVFTPPPETHEPSGKRKAVRPAGVNGGIESAPAMPQRPVLSMPAASPLDSLIDAETAVNLAQTHLRKVGSQKHERHGNLQVALSAVRNAAKHIEALLESEERS
jgi:hypothetical protein